MKWILSPSKTQLIGESQWACETRPDFESHADLLAESLRATALSCEALGQLLKIKGDQLQSVQQNYLNWKQLNEVPAIERYTGSVFKGLDRATYGETEKAYLRDHLRILSALYGVLRPFDAVKPYRLDMTNKLLGGTAYQYWDPVIGEYFGDELVINLASTEFSKVLRCNMITLEFKETSAEGILVTKSTYAKMARGKMMDYAVKQKISNPEAIKGFKWGGYAWRSELSRDHLWVFAR